MKYFFLLLFSAGLCCSISYSQKRTKKTKSVVLEKEEDLLAVNLQSHIKILSSDSLEGRRTGTVGEQLAASYIKNQFTEIGVSPKGEQGSYFQLFEVNEGKVYAEKSSFYINDFKLQPEKDFFPLNISGNGEINEITSPILRDANTTWFIDLKDILVKNESNPHFDVMPFLQEKINEFLVKGISGVLVHNSHPKLNDNLNFDKKATITGVKVPVIYLSKEAYKKHIRTNDAAVEIKVKISIEDKKRKGTNVIAAINNNAEKTIIIGAHYDHLGYGEDHNSLYSGNRMVHNGADDNASGVAALLELARMLKKTGYKNNNYLFIAFSGEELGLFGSKYFTEHPTVEMNTVNYMINMDMIGRLSDSSKTVTIGGFGTSPSWGQLIKPADKWGVLSIKTDSTGTGPSDHTSFYLKSIPVLFFFTGTHSDYHKPTDDVEKINFGGEEKIVHYIANLIRETNNLPKLSFSKTRETSGGSSRTRFSVSLGIMPDYTYSGAGVRADGISEGKLAQKIGLQPGDIIIKIGDLNISSVENYMKALGSFNKGDSTQLIITRGGKEIKYDITF